MAKRYKVFRGDTFLLRIPVTLSGVAYNITGCTLYFTVKSVLTQADDVGALVQKTTGTGIVHTTPASGLADLTIDAATMGTLPINRELYYDIQLKDASAIVTTLETGTITVIPEVTRTTA